MSLFFIFGSHSHFVLQQTSFLSLVQYNVVSPVTLFNVATQTWQVT